MSVVNTETGEVIDLDRAAAERRAERIRLRLDTIADNYAAVMPMIRDSIAQRDDLALGYPSVGAYVADRFGGSLQRLGVEVRRAVVGELTAAGMSTRAIAPVVGVHHDTVARDVRRVVGTTPETPEGEGTPTVGASAAVDTGGANSRPPVCTKPSSVTGLDGKTYSRPDPATQVAAAVAEFPDLAWHAETAPARDVLNMADDLRRYRDRGELDMRLDNLRRAICVAQAKRDGTYQPNTTAVMGEDGTYRMQPLPPQPITRTCPTCSGRGVIEETL